MTVYSKDRGITHPEHPRAMGDRAPSYRQSPRERVQVPPNYSGHAIVDGEERPLGSSFASDSDALPSLDLPAAEQPTPRFDGLPRVSQLGDSHRRQSPTYLPATAYAETVTPPEETADTPSTAPLSHQSPQNTTPAHGAPTNATHPHGTPPSPVSSPWRALGTLSLGVEELLLLGLILFLLRENTDCPDRGDLDETVILLGLLLLLG